MSLPVELVLILIVTLNRGAFSSSNSNADDQWIFESPLCEPRNLTCICGERLKIIAVPQ